MTDFGTDISGDTDISPTLQDASGLAMMRQVAVRRLSTPNCSLLSAPDELTCDLREFLSADFPRDKRGVQIISSTATAALQADQRFLSARVSVDWLTDSMLEVKVHCVTAEGSFDLVLSVSAATIEVLSR